MRIEQSACSSDGQEGQMSIAIDCHAASKSLCPSNKLDMPAFPLQGMSFRYGVRFSVHTTSRASCPWRRCSCADEFRALPAGGKIFLGLTVRVESIKFREAQNRPDKVFVRVSQRASALVMLSVNSSFGIADLCNHTLRGNPPQPKPTARLLCPPL